MEDELIYSPLQFKVTRDGVTVDISIYRSASEVDWILEVEDHTGGSTVWDDRFPADQTALDEAMSAIETHEGPLRCTRSQYRCAAC